MLLNDYQKGAVKTAIYPETAKIAYPVLGLASEAGEIAGKLKKHIRDGGEVDKTALAYELGDVLWYVAVLARDLDMTLEEVAKHNLDKLRDRQERVKLGGSGDNR